MALVASRMGSSSSSRGSYGSNSGCRKYKSVDPTTEEMVYDRLKGGLYTSEFKDIYPRQETNFLPIMVTINKLGGFFLRDPAGGNLIYAGSVDEAKKLIKDDLSAVNSFLIDKYRQVKNKVKFYDVDGDGDTLEWDTAQNDTTSRFRVPPLEKFSSYFTRWDRLDEFCDPEGNKLRDFQLYRFNVMPKRISNRIEGGKRTRRTKKSNKRRTKRNKKISKKNRK
jgi:hypothetical protein